MLVINARQYKQRSVYFACRLAQATGGRLTAFFMDQPANPENPAPEENVTSVKTAGATTAENVAENEVARAINSFVLECQNHNLPPVMLSAKKQTLQEIIMESRFADLLLIDPATNVSGKSERLPTGFTKKLLAGSECPVMLTPEKETETEEVVFCYDGSASAVFAAKQFTYLFPLFKNKPVVLLTVSSSNETDEQDQRHMQQWLETHYKSIEYKTLTGDAGDQLFTHFFLKENKLLVMGAYGRSTLSTLFRPSTAKALIRDRKSVV